MWPDCDLEGRRAQAAGRTSTVRAIGSLRRVDASGRGGVGWRLDDLSIASGSMPAIAARRGDLGFVRIRRASCGRLPAASRLAAIDNAGDPCAPVIVGHPDGNYIVPGVLGGVIYASVDGVATPARRVRAAGARERPAIVLVHGGGYTSGSRVAHVGQLLEALSAAALPWFSVDYRLGGPARRADAVEDVGRAIAFVRCNATRFGIDPDRLVLLGEDTGAEVALALVHRRAPGVTGAALVGGRFDGCDARDSPRQARSCSSSTAPMTTSSRSTRIRARCRPDVSAERCELVDGARRHPSIRELAAVAVGLQGGAGAVARPDGPFAAIRADLAGLGPSAQPWPAAASPRPPRPRFLAPGLHKRLTWDRRPRPHARRVGAGDARAAPACTARARRRLGGRRSRHLHHARSSSRWRGRTSHGCRSTTG